MSNRYPPGGFDYDNHKELVASLAALRAKNAELETRVRELETERDILKRAIWDFQSLVEQGVCQLAQDSDDIRNEMQSRYKVRPEEGNLKSWMNSHLTPPLAEQPPSEPREEKE